MKESLVLSVLAAFTLLAIAAGNARADEDEDRAVQLIEEMGGKAIRDFKQPGEPVVRVEFLIRGYATFERSDCIVAKRLGDGDLKCLAGLKQLRVLSLAGSGVGDDGLKTLADLKLPQLRELDLTNMLLTDDGMKHLANLKQLEKLTLIAKNPREDQTGYFQPWVDLCSARTLARVCLHHRARRGMRYDLPLRRFDLGALAGLVRTSDSHRFR